MERLYISHWKTKNKGQKRRLGEEKRNPTAILDRSVGTITMILDDYNC